LSWKKNLIYSLLIPQDLHNGGGFAHTAPCCSFITVHDGTHYGTPPLLRCFALFVVCASPPPPPAPGRVHVFAHFSTLATQEGLTLASVPPAPPPGSAAVLSQQQQPPPPPSDSVAAGGRSGSMHQLFIRPTLRSLVRPHPPTTCHRLLPFCLAAPPPPWQTSLLTARPRADPCHQLAEGFANVRASQASVRRTALLSAARSLSLLDAGQSG
jgi:hypothetical protein